MSKFAIKGVYSVNDFLDTLQEMTHSPLDGGDSCGWWNMEDLYKVKRGQWTIVTGIPNHGKSMFVDNLMIQLAKHHDWKFLICSPENQPIERHIVSLIEIYTGKKYGKNYYGVTEMNGEELGKGLLFVDEHFKFIYPEETDFHIDYILDLYKEIYGEWKFDGTVLDPYNELEHKRPNGMTETEYISQLLTKFRRFHRSHNAHGFMVAHPTKLKEVVRKETSEEDAKQMKIYAMPSLYDISGSANWRNKADNGLVVYRDFTTEPQKTIVSVQKIRFRECGKLGQAEFAYNPNNNQLTEARD